MCELITEHLDPEALTGSRRIDSRQRTLARSSQSSISAIAELMSQSSGSANAFLVTKTMTTSFTKTFLE